LSIINILWGIESQIPVDPCVTIFALRCD